jgi:predicted transcriptional regulator
VGKASQNSQESSKVDADHCSRGAGSFVKTLADSDTSYTSWCSRVISAAGGSKRELYTGRSGDTYNGYC